MTPIETTLFVSACAWGTAWALWSSGKIHAEHRRTLTETKKADPPTDAPGLSSVETFRAWEKRQILRRVKEHIHEDCRLSGELHTSPQFRQVPFDSGEIIGTYDDGTPIRAWRGQ